MVQQLSNTQIHFCDSVCMSDAGSCVHDDVCCHYVTVTVRLMMMVCVVVVGTANDDVCCHYAAVTGVCAAVMSMMTVLVEFCWVNQATAIDVIC
jgi:hypothetical protein